MCEGQFDVLVETGSGPMVLCTYSAGDHANSAFGELALATGKPQAAEIVARTEGRRFIGLALTCLSEDPSRSRSQVAFLQSSLDPKAKKCTHSNKCTKPCVRPVGGCMCSLRPSCSAISQASCFSWTLTHSQQWWHPADEAEKPSSRRCVALSSCSP